LVWNVLMNLFVVLHSFNGLMLRHHSSNGVFGGLLYLLLNILFILLLPIIDLGSWLSLLCLWHWNLLIVDSLVI